MAKVTNTELSAIIRAEIEAADGQANSQLSIERGLNMDYYQAKPFGNEIEGRSQVVSSDVADTIDWIMPTLIRIFCSGEDAVEFEPETPQDVPVAKQATEYANFIWNRDNQGFQIFHSWFKDALLQKNGIIKIWWDDTEKTKRERYYGLDDAAFAEVVGDKSVEVSEHTEREEEVPGPDGQPQDITVHDVVITRTKAGGKVCVVPVPPEEFLLSKDARSIKDARFVGHRRKRFVSDLIEEGFDRKQVEALSGDETSINTDAEAIKRDTVENVGASGAGTGTVNNAMRQVWVTEGYIKADVDGDGIAEMRKVVVAGAGYDILSNDAWDTPRPFVALTPIPMPHRFWGRALADLIRDIQLIKSTIFRQYLDNLYLANNQREQVIEANIVDPSEVLSSAPGRKIRIKNGEAVFPIQVPDVSSQALEGLAYVDSVREARTGVSDRTNGLGADAIDDETATKTRLMASAAQGKIELIARIFAETGVKDAFRLILKLICEYQQEPRVVRLTKEKWVPMDPRTWNSDMDMTVRVGMGMGDKDLQIQHAMMIGAAQEKAIMLGFVSPDNLKNAAELLVNATGQKGVERFFTFPQGPEATKGIQLPPPNQKPGTDPQTLIQMEQVKAQAKLQATQMQAQAKAATDQHLNQLEAQRHHMEHQDEMEMEKVKAALSVVIAHIENVGKIASAQIAAKASTDQAVLASEQAQSQQAA